MYWQVDGSVQDCSNSSALAMEFLQSCPGPSIDIKINNMWISCDYHQQLHCTLYIIVNMVYN